MSQNPEISDSVKKLAAAFGVTLLEKLGSSLDPEQLIAEASAVFSTSLKEVILEILQDPESMILRSLMDRLYQEIDEHQVVSAISEPLANNLSVWFKEEASDLIIQGVLNSLDKEELTRQLSKRIANKMVVSSS